MQFSRQFIQVLTCFFFCFAWITCGAENQTKKIQTTHLTGNCFVQPLSITNSAPKNLSLGKKIDEFLPFVLGTSRQSFLEFECFWLVNFAKIRMGSNAALEFRQDNSYLLHKGACLFTHRENLLWTFNLSGTVIRLSGFGTWMIESLSSGIKVILLEGKLTIVSDVQNQVLSSGDLILISQTNPMGTKPFAIDLPLLLGTSRLINEFPTKLHSNSRLFSAAQVQALRVKRRYDALIGDVSIEKKLQLWTVPQK